MTVHIDFGQLFPSIAALAAGPRDPGRSWLGHSVRGILRRSRPFNPFVASAVAVRTLGASGGAPSIPAASRAVPRSGDRLRRVRRRWIGQRTATITLAAMPCPF